MNIFSGHGVSLLRTSRDGRSLPSAWRIPAVMIFIVFLVFFFILMILVLPWISVPVLLRRKTHHAKKLRTSSIPPVSEGGFNFADSGLSLSKALTIFNRAFAGPAVLPDGSPDGNGGKTAPPVAPGGKSVWK